MGFIAATCTYFFKKSVDLLKDKWKKLHRLIYIIAILGVTHFIWLVKKDLTEPLIYAVIILILLLFRFKFKRIKKINLN